MNARSSIKQVEQPQMMTSGMLHYGGTRALAAAVGLGAALILPHFIAANTLGQFYVLISAVAYLGVLMRFGGEYVLFRQSTLKADGTEARAWDSQAFGQATRYLSIICLILLLGAVLMLHCFGGAARLNENLRFLSDVWVQAFLISFNSSLLVHVYQIAKSRTLIVLSGVVKSAITNFIFLLLVIVTFFRAGDVNLSAYANLYLASSFLAVLIAVRLCRTISLPQWLKGMTTANKAYYRSDSWYSFSYSMLFVLFTELEILLASLYLSPSEVAVYGTARRMTLACAIFVEFSNVFLPRVIANGMSDPQSLSRQLSSFSAKMAAMSLLVIVGVLVLGDWAFSLILPSEFSGITDLLAILLLAPFVAVLLGPSEVLLLMHSKKSGRIVLSVALMIATGIQFAIAVSWLLPVFGMFGLAASSVVAMAVYRGILALYVRKYLLMRVVPGVS